MQIIGNILGAIRYQAGRFIQGFKDGQAEREAEWNPTPVHPSAEMSMRLVEALERSPLQPIQQMDLEALRERVFQARREVDPDYKPTELSDLLRNHGLLP